MIYSETVTWRKSRRISTEKGLKQDPWIDTEYARIWLEWQLTGA